MEFEALLTEGAAVPVEGWDFSWFEGRATEQRPSWGYARLLSERLDRARSALDLQTGGGEVFGWALGQASGLATLLAATEFLSQMVGAGSNRELYEYLRGPQPDNQRRSPEVAVRGAESAGLRVVDLRAETLDVEFFDVGAVVHFLRKVPGTVPDFSVERYRDQLAALHGEIERHGSFACHSQRYLIEARRA